MELSALLLHKKCYIYISLCFRLFFLVLISDFWCAVCLYGETGEINVSTTMIVLSQKTWTWFLDSWPDSALTRLQSLVNNVCDFSQYIRVYEAHKLKHRLNFLHKMIISCTHKAYRPIGVGLYIGTFYSNFC